MTKIEKGQLFVVQKGVLLSGAFSGGGPFYDRSYAKMVFRAKEVCGVHVAGEVVHDTWYSKSMLGRVISLNGEDLELRLVSEEYLAALAPEAKPDEEVQLCIRDE